MSFIVRFYEVKYQDQIYILFAQSSPSPSFRSLMTAGW